jgi:membrane associated rhomboid family serine protease
VIPYHDENATQRTPYVTFLLIAMNVVAWLVLEGAGETRILAASVCQLGLIPAQLTGALPPGASLDLGEGVVCRAGDGGIASVFTSMFMHGSWMHLIGNMWFLWLFGNNIEDSMTRPRFVAFYLLSGIGAALLQVAIEPGSRIPMVGASGAISGVMGAYLVLYPRVRVFTLVPLGFFLTSIALPAWAMLVYWMVIQFAGGLTRIGAEGGGVAFWAHIGGFVVGAVLVKLFERRDRVAKHQSHRWRPSHVR